MNLRRVITASAPLISSRARGLGAVGMVLLGAGSWIYQGRQIPNLPELAVPQVPLEVQTLPTAQEFIWWEAESPRATNFPPYQQQPFAPQGDEQAELLSQGAWIGLDKASPDKFLEYRVRVPKAGRYNFYARKFWQHGPFRWRWDEQPWQQMGEAPLLDRSPMRQFVEINWVQVGAVELAAGEHSLRIELTQTTGAAAFDCFVLSAGAFQARGKLQPNQRYSAQMPDWFVFDPEPDRFADSALDLRSLNPAIAGQDGWLKAQDGQLVHSKTGQVERFWAVNIGPTQLQQSPEQMRYMARFLAKRGVNLVRLHGRLWDTEDIRRIPPQTLANLAQLVDTLKQAGIHTSLSIYFPLWLQPQTSKIPELASGYSPDQAAYGLLYFHPKLQELYRGWWRQILSTPLANGTALGKDPALAMVELVNEDSYFFWTFKPGENPPSPQAKLLETQFSQWLTQTYGSLERAKQAWSEGPAPPAITDLPDRMSLMSAGDIAQHRTTRRAQDTARFLAQSQQRFYADSIRYLKQDLGYGGLTIASNWITASPQYLGPLDKLTNTVADVMDQHGYFEPLHQGDRAAFSLNLEDRYRDRSALVFAPATEDPKIPLMGRAREFSMPLMAPSYADKPQIISEINWPTPNRFRTEFPVLSAAYSSLQGTDGLAFFALDTPGWSPRLEKFTIASPAILGQFPAAAWLYRKGLVQTGTPTTVDLPVAQIQALQGGPAIAPQNLDLLRAKDVADGGKASNALDPLRFLTGPVQINFLDATAPKPTASNQPTNPPALSQIDPWSQTVKTPELQWDYGRGLVTVNAPQAAGFAGALRLAKSAGILQVSSPMDYGTVLLVALDGRSLDQSQNMLLQVMSEEQNFGWSTVPAPRGSKKIESTGQSPIVLRNLAGQVRLNRPDAGQLKAIALDANGYGNQEVGRLDGLELRPQVLHYLITKASP
jgi:hypothetical protein